jgi:hypothetical protein
VPDDIESLIRTLEQQRFAAIVADDWESFASLCDDDLRYVHASGTIDTRDSYLAKLRGGFYDYHEISATIDHVVVSPELALVRGTMAATLRAGEREIAINNVITAAWVNRGSTWLLVAQQSTGA